MNNQSTKQTTPSPYITGEGRGEGLVGLQSTKHITPSPFTGEGKGRGALSKQELALLYNPKCSPRSAVGTLRRWIARCAPLRKELLKTGYSKKQHILSVQQVRLIMEYLGEPC